jgi:hypothetical protein
MVLHDYAAGLVVKLYTSSSSSMLRTKEFSKTIRDWCVELH